MRSPAGRTKIARRFSAGKHHLCSAPVPLGTKEGGERPAWKRSGARPGTGSHDSFVPVGTGRSLSGPIPSAKALGYSQPPGRAENAFRITPIGDSLTGKCSKSRRTDNFLHRRRDAGIVRSNDIQG